MNNKKCKDGEAEDLDEDLLKQPILNNQNNELFDDDSYVAHKLINVKRVELPQNGENWEIYEDNRVAFTLKGVRLTKKEKSFLYTPEGIKLLMNEYKAGNKSIAGMRKKIKELCKK